MEEKRKITDNNLAEKEERNAKKILISGVVAFIVQLISLIILFINTHSTQYVTGYSAKYNVFETATNTHTPLTVSIWCFVIMAICLISYFVLVFFSFRKANGKHAPKLGIFAVVTLIGLFIALFIIASNNY